MYKRCLVVLMGTAMVLAAAATAPSGPPPAGVAASSAGVGNTTPGILPPQSTAYGKSLAQWLNDYWRWNYRDSNRTEPYQPGPNTVAFLPLPAGEQISGDWTPGNPAYLLGEIDVPLKPKTPFVLPLFAWLAERYTPESGIPDDPVIPKDLMQSVVTDATVTLDGKPILQNFWDYFVGPMAFDPIVQYPPPPAFGVITGAVAFEGVGFVSAPLPPGKHVIHLYERYVLEDGWVEGIAGFGEIFDNTWNITVQP
jgi:hypothetical protein